MATFANFGLFDSSMEERRRANAMRQANSRQMGQDIGSITGSFLQNYNENKRKEVLKNINEAWDYEEERKREDEEYKKAMASGPNEEIDADFGTMFDDVEEKEPRTETFGADVDVPTDPKNEYQFNDDGTTTVTYGTASPGTREYFRADQEADLNEGDEFQILDDSPKTPRTETFPAGVEVPTDPNNEYQFNEDGTTTVFYGNDGGATLVTRKAYIDGQKELEEDFKDLDNTSSGPGMRESTDQEVKDQEPTFMSPEEEKRHIKMRSIFAKGLTDEQKYRRSAALLAPYDPRGAREMIEYADSRAKLERQLGEKERISRAQSKSKEPITNITKTNTFIQQRQRANEQLRDRIDGTDTNQTELRARLEGEINKNNDEVKFAKTQLAKYAKDMPLEALYTFEGNSKTPKGLNIDPNAPKGLKTPEMKMVSSLDTIIKGKGTQAEQDAAIDLAVRNQTIDKVTGDQFKEDLATKRKAASERAAPKRDASKDWNKVTSNSGYIKTRQNYNDVMNSRKTLRAALNDPNLSVAKAKQLGFKVARVVTGTGPITESELEGTQGVNWKKDALDQVGLGWMLRGSDNTIEVAKEGIRAALEDFGGTNTAIDNMNIYVSDYNNRHPSFKKKLTDRMSSKKVKELTDEDLLKELGI